MKKLFYLVLPALIIVSCKNMSQKENKESEKAITPKLFYGMIGPDSVFQYSLVNNNGMLVKVLNYGGTVTDIMAPDKNGTTGDVILGYDSLQGYLQKANPYFGSLVGRYANRIANGKFILDGRTYTLDTNDHGNSLHGGFKGFDKEIWTVADFSDSSLNLVYESKDGEGGYPGNLHLAVKYSLTATNELRIDYSATTDKSTPINLTNHCYFNLSAGSDPNILNHELMLNAKQFTEVNDKLIPTGKLIDVKGTPMDFIIPKKIGRDIGELKGGYDHNWVLVKHSNYPELAATVYHAPSGRFMEVYTTEPGLQMYTGNFLDSSLIGRNGTRYGQHAALCLEAQHFPDSPNEPSFPNTILKPGETYHQTTIYKFSVK